MHSPMKNIFIYNLDHDYALGDNSSNYTPAKSMLRMRNIYACFPAIYANKGDYILYLDSETSNIPNKHSEFNKGYSLFSNLIKLKNLKVIGMRELASLDLTQFTFQPWGWDNALINKLYKFGVPESKIPVSENIANLRKASSRFTSRIIFQEIISQLREKGDAFSSTLFSEFEDIIETSNCGEVLDFFKRNKSIYVKSPWSSSGRGLIFTDELNETQVAQWCNGIIRKQGGVVMEKGYERVLDFSSEWILRDGIVEFVGFGMFIVSSRGKYKANIVADSLELRHKIIQTVSDYSHIGYSDAVKALDMIIERQKEALTKHYGDLSMPGIAMPIGVDMFVTVNGSIHPCVEVNFRNTMGHVAIEVNRQLNSVKDDAIRTELTKFVNGNEISLPEIV